MPGLSPLDVRGIITHRLDGSLLLFTGPGAFTVATARAPSSVRDICAAKTCVDCSLCPSLCAVPVVAALDSSSGCTSLRNTSFPARSMIRAQIPARTPGAPDSLMLENLSAKAVPLLLLYADYTTPSGSCGWISANHAPSRRRAFQGRDRLRAMHSLTVSTLPSSTTCHRRPTARTPWAADLELGPSPHPLLYWIQLMCYNVFRPAQDYDRHGLPRREHSPPAGSLPPAKYHWNGRVTSWKQSQQGRGLHGTYEERWLTSTIPRCFAAAR